MNERGRPPHGPSASAPRPTRPDPRPRRVVLLSTRAAAAALAIATLVAGCGRERRSLAADQPQTPPTGAGDPRAPRYEKNAYQISQGGRYFTWYGCAGCHGAGAEGVKNLAKPQPRHGDFDQVY